TTTGHPVSHGVGRAGRRFTADTPADPANLGSRLGGLKVGRVVGGKTFESPALVNASKTLRNGDQMVVALAPRSVAVGQADILLRRPVNTLTLPPHSTISRMVVQNV